MSRSKLIIRAAVLISLITVLFFQAFPGFLFSNQFKLENITVFSNKDISETGRFEVQRSVDILKQSPLYDDEVIYEIFITDKEFFYRLLSPDFTNGSFARTNFFDNIIVRKCNVVFEVCESKSSEYNKRSLNGLISHEITHVNIRRKFGYLGELFIPVWKKEGVADYISKSSSYFGLGGHDTKAYEYYMYRLAAAHVIEKEGIGIVKYLEMDLNFEAIKNELYKTHN